MDSTMTDPELASEMVKLLAQELKLVRAQLREAERGASTASSTGEPLNRLAREQIQLLVAENETVKRENAALQANVSRLRDELGHAASIKSEDGTSNALQYEESMEHMREELAGLLAERGELIREKMQEDALKYKEKRSALREKYNRVKTQARGYSEELIELRAELSSRAQELAQAKKGVVTEIDFREFLGDATYEPVEGQLELAALQPYSRNICSKVHKNLAHLCQGPYFINTHEVIWSPEGIALGLIIQPTFQYNPKATSWTKLEVEFAVGERMDVCLSTSKALYYLGTYERVDTQNAMALAPDTLQYLEHKKMDYVSKKTTLFPDLVPPSQTQMMKNMYRKGVIRLQCFAIKCVAFNQALLEGLQAIGGSMKSSHPVSQGSTTPSTSSKQGRKRKRNAESTDHFPQSKKEKH